MNKLEYPEGLSHFQKDAIKAVDSLIAAIDPADYLSEIELAKRGVLYNLHSQYKEGLNIEVHFGKESVYLRLEQWDNAIDAPDLIRQSADKMLNITLNRLSQLFRSELKLIEVLSNRYPFKWTVLELVNGEWKGLGTWTNGIYNYFGRKHKRIRIYDEETRKFKELTAE